MSGGLEKLAIFDMDDTLIYGDSFRRILLRRAKRSPRIFALIVLRKVKLLSRTDFARRAHRAARAKFNIDAIATQECERLIEQTMNDARQRMDAGQTVILISASPDEYVKVIGERLGFDHARGSHWQDGEYRHLHGPGKIAYLEHYFPKNRFEWVYAISDSKHDRGLLERAKKGVLFDPKTA